LLARTLSSFFEFNTYPVNEVIVIEDGPQAIDASLARICHGKPVRWINTGRRVGQIAAIDKAYRLVRTPYIFHMEDDWEFYAPSFIEKSLAILKENANCLQVWIRAHDDTNSHPIEEGIFWTSCGIPWQKLASGHKDVWHGLSWHGFSFNPGLRRLQDYTAIGGYSEQVKLNSSEPGSAESALSCLYKEKGFYAAILADQSLRGYVRHIGEGRRVGGPSDASPQGI
jgi:GT2 family glycosyltransferase